MRLQRLLMLSIAAHGMSTTPLAAQVLPLPGVRVRVVDTADHRPDDAGVLVRRVGDTVVLADKAGRERSVRVHSWQRLEVSSARKRHVVRNGLIGAASGALVLGVVALAVADESDKTSDSCFAFNEAGCWTVTVKGTPREATAAVVGGYGAVIGAIVGGLTGLPRRDVWVPASPPASPVRNVGVRAGQIVRFSIPLRAERQLR